MKRLLLFTTIGLAAAALSAGAAGVKENWDKHCLKCHGAEGKGDTKTGKKLQVKDYTDSKVQEMFTDDAMFKAIKEGVKEGDKTKMKGYPELSDDEIKELVKHIRSFKK